MAKNTYVKGDKPLTELLRAPQGDIDVTTIPTDNAPGYPGEGKKDAEQLREGLVDELSELQERLFANGRANPDTAPRVLLILQGMDGSGKGGVIRHAIGLVDPQGVAIKSFKAPNDEEKQHDFLWRIEKALPGPGMIGIFDRSQYEDVLVVRVDELVPEDVWQGRYDEINAFEKKLADAGVVILKCFLHEGKDEQKERLLARLESDEKYWKYSPGDLGPRAKWDEYMAAYSDLLERCNPDHAPWYIVPADKKWYRDWAVAQLLHEKLAEMNLQWPKAEFDVEAERAKVEAS